MNWIPNPNYAKATNEVVLYAPGIPVGKCIGCGMPTNGSRKDEENIFICSFCEQEEAT